MHSPSEHTIDGKRFDIELQIVHVGDQQEGQIDEFGNMIMPKFDQQTISVMFSKDASYKWPTAENAKNVVVDDFFDSLELTNLANVDISPENFKNLFSVLNLENRWMYSGSTTYPPCDKKVIWHVLQKIYPVDSKFVDYLRIKQSGWESGVKHQESYV